MTYITDEIAQFRLPKDLQHPPVLTGHARLSQAWYDVKIAATSRHLYAAFGRTLYRWNVK
jgi:hypothetical protein